MQMYSGILSALTGPLGPVYLRRLKNGDFVFVPRYRTDKKSPEQLEQRRRFTAIMKIASKLYLPILKKYYNDPWRDYGPLAATVKRSLDEYYEAESITRLTFPTGISPLTIETAVAEEYNRHRAELWWFDHQGGPYLPTDKVLVWVVSAPGNVVSVCPAALQYSDYHVSLNFVPYKINTWMMIYVLLIRVDGSIVYVLNTPLARVDQITTDGPL